MRPDIEVITCKRPEIGEYNQRMEALTRQSLEHAAWSAMNTEGKTNTEVVLYCIKADPDWRWLIDRIDPDLEPIFQEQRAKNITPIALGPVSWNFCNIVADHFDDMSQEIMAVPAANTMKAILLSNEGCTVISVEPKPNHSRLS